MRFRQKLIKIALRLFGSEEYLDVGRAVPIILTGVLGVCWPTILAPSRGDDVGGGETFLSFPPEVSSLQELSDWLSDDGSEIVE